MQPDRDDISFDNVCYFFDANRRDAMDRGVLRRRAGQFLALRDKLLALSDEQFEIAIRTLEGMLTPPTLVKSEPAAERRAALELFKRVSTPEVNPV